MATITQRTITLKPVSAKDEFPDIQTIRNAIPKHCFEPSALRSLSYVVRDVIMVGSLGWAATTYIPTIEDATLRAVAWAVYGYVQGLFCTGIWILGHEAGHGAFSKHALLNDVVGWLTHSSLMVPYFSWKYSHHRHHRFTGHMEKDMVFVPKTREEHEQKKQETSDLVEYIEETPVYQALTLLLHQLFGWPLYLLLNISAGSDSVQRQSDNILRRSHFDPYSIVFRPSEAAYIALSDLGLATTLGCLYLLSGVVGTWTTVLLYAQPFFWVHHWLIAITYLHHTHVEVPHYDAKNWTFVKGALATVDREFGFVGRHLFHGIIEYHVVHHLFPRIPFYYAEEATEAIKPVIGEHYCRDERSFLGQLWSNFTSLKFVDSDGSAAGRLKWVVQKSK